MAKRTQASERRGELIVYIGRSQADSWQSVVESLCEFWTRLYQEVAETPPDNRDWDTLFVDLRLDCGRFGGFMGRLNESRPSWRVAVRFFVPFIEARIL